jgi:signal transduction histidine kinase
LLSNAFKYSKAGTPVELAAQRKDDHVAVIVKDHGIGIATKDCRSIFEPFFRSEEVRRGGYPGTGLGLSVAARIAEVLHAELRCESTPGGGSTFTLSLPRVATRDNPAGEPSKVIEAV